MTADWDNKALADALVADALVLELALSSATNHMREAAKRLAPPPDLPEPSRAGHYS